MSPFQIRGVVEGFYGVFYTAPERDDLIRFLGRQGFNFYLYAPKNDRQHRARWREAYPPRIMEQFRNTAAIATEVGVQFAYALSPVVSLCHACKEDFEVITSKFQAFYQIGIRAFALCFDDMKPEFSYEIDRLSYKNYAEAHADLTNRIYEWLKERDCSFSICPTDYHGTAPFSDYIHELGRQLEPKIDVFYTGREICSPSILTEEVLAFGEAVKRTPIIWDNYPVNDLAMQPELHLAPISGRDADLHRAVKGILINPMIQAEASKIPLMSYADYLVRPESYQPEQAWEKALETIAGEESATALKLLAENSLYSCLDSSKVEKLDILGQATLKSLQSGQSVLNNVEVEKLDAYLNELDEATYHLKFRMENLALRSNLLPWIELIEHYLWMGRRALLLLRATESGLIDEHLLRMMNENFEDAQKHPKRMAGKSLFALVQYLKEKLEEKA
jgi:hyaluronoglucosaminidase